jgi:hypothetical protein
MEQVKPVLFSGLLSDALKAHVLAGGQALEKWDKSYTLAPTAPLCFRGRDFVKLYDQDKLRLIATARRYGVKVIKVDRPGQLHQHIDLVGAPMRRALADAETPGLFPGATGTPQPRDPALFRLAKKS